MWRTIGWVGIVSGTLWILVGRAGAEVGDPTIRTDHPFYAGEGAFQEVEDCSQFATEGKASPQDRAVALYLWLLTHQFHLMSPQEPYVPGSVPDNGKSSQEDLIVYDANRARFSYGYGLCGTVHAWNEPYWQSLGLRARRRAFPGHTNSEVQYGDGWHTMDTDMAGLVFREDGVVAGYDDVIRNPKLAESVRPPLPHYPFAWPADFNVMRQGWQQVARGGSWFKLYNGGYAAHPGVVQLRSGETLTRWFDRDHFGGPSHRRYWHHLRGGPDRLWTFVNSGTPTHDGAKSNSRGNASYANGEFTYRPDIASGRYREGIVRQTANVVHQAVSPRLRSRDGSTASVTFRHFSPYVICGDPDDDANPMSALATGGLVLDADFAGDVQVEVSADEGQTWKRVAVTERKPAASNAARANSVELDLTEQVKGRYGWQVRLTWSGQAGIDDLQFTTVTQVSQAIYPRLKPNGTAVTYRCASRGVVAVLPNFGLPESQVGIFEDVSRRSPNLAYRGRSPKSRLAYEVTDGRPANVVFRVEAPAPLVEVRAAMRYSLRVPPPPKADFRLAVSTDNGSSWREFARSDIPSDNEFSSGWLAGKIDVSPSKVNQALVRAQFDGDGTRTGLIDVQLYGLYRTADPTDVKVSFRWQENGQRREFDQLVKAGAKTVSFTVPTGGQVKDEFVRVAVP